MAGTQHRAIHKDLREVEVEGSCFQRYSELPSRPCQLNKNKLDWVSCLGWILSDVHCTPVTPPTLLCRSLQHRTHSPEFGRRSHSTCHPATSLDTPDHSSHSNLSQGGVAGGGVKRERERERERERGGDVLAVCWYPA